LSRKTIKERERSISKLKIKNQKPKINLFKNYKRWIRKSQIIVLDEYIFDNSGFPQANSIGVVILIKLSTR